MAGIIEAIVIATEIFNKSSDGLSGKDILKVMKGKEIGRVRADGSMLKLLGNYIVEPVCVVTKDLKENEILDNIIGLHSDIFTGFYMQTMDVLRSVHGMSDADAIDILGTDNGSVGRVLLNGAEIALEDRPVDYMADMLQDAFVLTVEGLEDDKFEYQKEKDKREYDTRFDKDKKTFRNRDEDRQDRLREAEHQKAKDGVRDRTATGLSEAHSDLLIPNALQRTVQITINRKTPTGVIMTVIIPITIKTQLIYTDADNIINAMAPNSADKSFMSRLDDYRASAVSFMDFIFANDLVKKYKHNKLKDKDDLLKLLQSRKISANSKYSDTGMAGFEKYYTMYIVSKPTSIKIENFLRGKLKSYKHKEAFLTQALGLSMTVVDEDYERVQMYLKDIKGVTDLTFKGIIKKGKGDSDMSEMVKALMANRPPVF